MGGDGLGGGGGGAGGGTIGAGGGGGSGRSRVVTLCEPRCEAPVLSQMTWPSAQSRGGGGGGIKGKGGGLGGLGIGFHQGGGGAAGGRGEGMHGGGAGGEGAIGGAGGGTSEPHRRSVDNEMPNRVARVSAYSRNARETVPSGSSVLTQPLVGCACVATENHSPASESGTSSRISWRSYSVGNPSSQCTDTLRSSAKCLISRAIHWPSLNSEPQRVRSLLSIAAATSRLADSEEEAITCASRARSVVPAGQSPGWYGCGGGSGSGGRGGGGGIGCNGGNGEGGGGPARRMGSGGGGAFGRDAHWLQAAHLQKEQADAVSTQKACQHCALKVSPSTVGVQAAMGSAPAAERVATRALGVGSNRTQACVRVVHGVHRITLQTLYTASSIVR